MLTDSQKQNRQEFVAALRELLAWYEANPDVPAIHENTLNVWANTTEHFLSLRRMLGASEKNSGSEWLTFRRKFGVLNLDVNILKMITCERVKVGEQKLPAEPAKPERVEPIYEWKCPPSLLAAAELSAEGASRNIWGRQP